MTLLAAVVVLLVFGPLLVIVPGILILSAIGLLSSRGAPRIVTKVFPCPFKRRRVRAEFLIAPGAAHPSSVTSCSAFRDPKNVTCAKRCLELADVRWTPPTGVFARWALTSDGVAGGLETPLPAPSPAMGSAIRLAG
jgi:hypothetical protein